MFFLSIDILIDASTETVVVRDPVKALSLVLAGLKFVTCCFVIFVICRLLAESSALRIKLGGKW